MTDWIKQIEASATKSLELLVFEAYQDITFENMSQICFGENILDQKIELEVNVGKKYLKKPMNIIDVIHTLALQLGQAALYRKINPIGVFYTLITKKPIALTRFTKSIENNCKITRKFLRDIIAKRKNNEIESKVEGKADLLSLFLESPDVFTDDDIIDELLDFLLAGTQTTSYATLTLLAHLAKSEESTSIIRKEFSKAT